MMMRAIPAMLTVLAVSPQPTAAQPFNAQVGHLDIALRFAEDSCPGYRVDTARWHRILRDSGMTERQLVEPPADTGLRRYRSGLASNPTRGCRAIWRDFGPTGFLAPGLLAEAGPTRRETGSP